MSILSDIPGADQNVIDYACSQLAKSPGHASRRSLAEELSKVHRDCRRIIMTEPSITDQQKLKLLQSLDDELEELGL